MAWQDVYTRDEFIALIRQLVEVEGLTATQAAERIGLDVTRNMLIGMAYRNQIMFRDPTRKQRSNARVRPLKSAVKPKAKKSSARKSPAKQPKKPKFTILDDDPVDTSVLISKVKADQCRAPLWPDRMGTKIKVRPIEAFVCGKPVEEGSSYCAEHRARLTMPEPPKRRSPARKPGPKSSVLLGRVR